MCIAVLALGIGANIAIFSVLDSVVLQGLPYPDLPRLVFVWERFPGLPAPVSERMQVARKNYLEWKRQANSFDRMEAYRGMRLQETGGDHPIRVDAGFASPGLFSLLGARARIGRLFTSAEDVRGADRVAVLSDAYFDSRFHGDPGTIGRTLRLSGADYTIVGVLPAGFHVPSTYEGDDQVKAQVWLPLSRLWDGLQDEHERALNVAARLKPGVTVGQARAEMAQIAKRLEGSEGEFDKGWQTAIYPFTVEDAKPQVHVALFVLAGAVGFLLLIGCANLANLTLARASLRGREVAIRLALGASRARVIRHLAMEALVVSLAGAAAGLLLAYWALRLMLALKPDDIQRPELIAINLPVFGFAVAAAVVTAVLFGLLPALAVARGDLNVALRSGGWGTSAVRTRSRQFLIVAEIALALVLVTGAGLMIRSFHQVMATGVGFDTDRMVTADVELPKDHYPDGAARARFFGALLERVGALPGVRSAALTDALPLHSVGMHNFYIAGRPEPEIGALPMSDDSHVSPTYLQTLGLRLEAGRWFTPSDLNAGHRVIAVSSEFVRKFFPRENPLGHTLLDPDKKTAYEIVAVVSDYRPMGVEAGTRPTMFKPDEGVSRGTLVVRAGGAENALGAELRDAVWSLDRSLPAVEMQPMQYYLDRVLSERRFNTLLLEIFAALAVMLAAIGIYGVLSNLVSSRAREIGIRMAIGATPADIGKLVSRQSTAPVAAGVVLGIAGSLVLGRFLESLLFRIHARDPLTIVLATCAILLLAPAALYLPLRRATRVDCTVALREE